LGPNIFLGETLELYSRAINSNTLWYAYCIWLLKMRLVHICRLVLSWYGLCGSALMMLRKVTCKVYPVFTHHMMPHGWVAKSPWIINFNTRWGE
jgi:hypothetical protein